MNAEEVNAQKLWLLLFLWKFLFMQNWDKMDQIGLKVNLFFSWGLEICFFLSENSHLPEIWRNRIELGIKKTIF